MRVDRTAELLVEARKIIAELHDALGHEGLCLDIPDPVPKLLKRLDKAIKAEAVNAR